MATSTPAIPGHRASLSLHLKRVLLMGSCFVTLLPLVWLVSASLSEQASLFAAPLLPRDITLGNYRQLVTDTLFLTWVRNSLVVCVAGSILALVLTSSMGYAFARFRFRGRGSGLLALFLLQMVPSSITIIAIYYLLSSAGLLNSHLGLTLVYAGMNIPFSAWLMKGFFDSIPIELEEAALIDGASIRQAMVRIVAPLALPMMAAVFLFNMIAFYNDYIIASVVLTGTDTYTVALGLRFFQSSQGANWALFSAGALAGAIPLVLIFYAMQRYLVGGLTAGAVKG